MKKRPDDFYAMIADDYEAALDLHEKPVRAIAEAYHIPWSTACRWVRRARELGLLREAAAPRLAPRAYATNRKLIDVAAALGVTPEALARAVIEHARGDLRVQSKQPIVDVA